MKVKQYETFKFNELSEGAKERAIEEFSDINVDFDWWIFTCDSVKETMGVEIKEFDMDKLTITTELCEDVEHVIKSILENFSEETDFYKTAKRWDKELESAIKEAFESLDDDEKIDFDFQYDFQREYDEIERGFKKELAEDYLSMLKKEFNNLTSEEAIIEAIEINDYDFLGNGKLDPF